MVGNFVWMLLRVDWMVLSCALGFWVFLIISWNATYPRVHWEANEILRYFHIEQNLRKGMFNFICRDILSVTNKNLSALLQVKWHKFDTLIILLLLDVVVDGVGEIDHLTTTEWPEHIDRKCCHSQLFYCSLQIGRTRPIQTMMIMVTRTRRCNNIGWWGGVRRSRPVTKRQKYHWIGGQAAASSDWLTDWQWSCTSTGTTIARSLLLNWNGITLDW